MTGLSSVSDHLMFPRYGDLLTCLEKNGGKELSGVIGNAAVHFGGQTIVLADLTRRVDRVLFRVTGGSSAEKADQLVRVLLICSRQLSLDPEH
jgi:hypothetical protein